MLAADVIERCNVNQEYALSSHFVRGLHVLLPFLIDNKREGEPDKDDKQQNIYSCPHVP